MESGVLNGKGGESDSWEGISGGGGEGGHMGRGGYNIGSGIYISIVLEYWYYGGGGVLGMMDVWGE